MKELKFNLNEERRKHNETKKELEKHKKRSILAKSALTRIKELEQSVGSYKTSIDAMDKKRLEDHTLICKLKRENEELRKVHNQPTSSRENSSRKPRKASVDKKPNDDKKKEIVERLFND